MSVREDLIRKKKDLEGTIKNALETFMNETGLLITSISASNDYLGVLKGNLSEEELNKMKKETLVNSLKISVKL